MSRTDEIAEYVRAGLMAGQSPDALSAALAQAGWGPREIAGALEAWTPGAPGMPPIPRPRAYVSAREAVVYGLLFLLLGCICWHISMLGFRLIDLTLGDPTHNWFSPEGVRWNIATLLPTVPLFLWLNRRVVRATIADTGQRRSLVRKWFASVTLLIAVLFLLGDVVAVLYALLNGDVTTSFVAKAVLVAGLSVLALAYYRDELDER